MKLWIITRFLSYCPMIIVFLVLSFLFNELDICGQQLPQELTNPLFFLSMNTVGNILLEEGTDHLKDFLKIPLKVLYYFYCLFIRRRLYKMKCSEEDKE